MPKKITKGKCTRDYAEGLIVLQADVVHMIAVGIIFMPKVSTLNI